jgi:dipicolinate synthase subunit A
MDTTLHDSNVLILGFGRIGKVLAKMLCGIGAKVYITARNETDFAWIRAYGYEKIEYKELNYKLKNFDVVFNTVPTMILDEERLLLLKKDCLIVDLASKPGGVDFKRAEELNLQVDWALGLPGKIAPVTAAKYMKELILKNI